MAKPSSPDSPLRVTFPRSIGASGTTGCEGTPDGLGSIPDIAPESPELGSERVPGLPPGEPPPEDIFDKKEDP